MDYQNEFYQAHKYELKDVYKRQIKDIITCKIN